MRGITHGDAKPAAGVVPSVAFCLSVGVTGHRALNGADAALAGTIATILADLRDAAVALHAAEPLAFAAAALPPRLVCPLAEGADQLAAGLALDLGFGFELHAVLPFDRDDFASDFAGPAAVARFRDLLGRATRVFELACPRRDENAAYSLAGRATVAHADVLIAVWDGLPVRGRGGTAEVVDFAARRGVPVIHVAMDPAVAPRLIWSAHDPHLTASHLEDYTSRAADREAIDRVLRQRLATPPTRSSAHISRPSTPSGSIVSACGSSIRCCWR